MEKQHSSWTRTVFIILAVLVGVPGVAALTLGGILAWRYLRPDTTPEYSNIIEHFKYGSIGSEVSGLPYWVWKALPDLFPEKFNGNDLSIFGFLYETDSKRNQAGSSYRSQPADGPGRRKGMVQLRTLPYRNHAGNSGRVSADHPGNALQQSRFARPH